MSRREEKPKRWQIRIQDLLVTTTCFAVSIPMLMSRDAASVGVLVLCGTFYGLINAGRNRGGFLIGFAWGVGVPVAAILFLLFLSQCPLR